MRFLFLASLVPALTGLASAAPAQVAKPDQDKVVCKKEPREGSRVLTRNCKTQAEWDAIAEQAKRSMAETRDQPQINPTNCGGSRPC
jgi:hypothetical protein